MSKFLAIIPARGGSKGIKNKNIICINDRPLIDYTIKPALKARDGNSLEEVIVSTDSSEIAKISKELGAKVPFLRPKNISIDSAKSVDVIIHAIDFFEKQGIFYENIILLQPTSPLRQYEDIERAVKFYLENESESLISVYKEIGFIESSLYSKKGKIAVPWLKNHNKGIRRQESEGVFVRNGAFYITSVRYLKKYKQIISEKPLLFEMPKSRSLNIDEAADLIKLKNILSFQSDK